MRSNFVTERGYYRKVSSVEVCYRKISSCKVKVCYQKVSNFEVEIYYQKVSSFEVELCQ